jgi:hypothetical protein
MIRKYKILETVMLGFHDGRDQTDAFYDPDKGFLLEREEDGDTIFVTLGDKRKESITQAHAIEVWLEDGKIALVEEA